MENKLVELKLEELDMISGGRWDSNTLDYNELTRLMGYADYALIYYNANDEARFWEYYDKYHAYEAELEEKYGPSEWDFESFNTKFKR